MATAEATSSNVLAGGRDSDVAEKELKATGQWRLEAWGRGSRNHPARVSLLGGDAGSVLPEPPSFQEARNTFFFLNGKCFHF